MDNFLTELGIKHEITNSYTPEMNGVAERFNLTALDGIKILLKSSEVPHKFWGEALLCFTYAWNRICHKDSNKTPFEKYSGRKPSVLHLKPFGCLAYAGVPKQIRKKFNMRAKMGIMMGYAQRTKGYRIWLIDENKLVETINVRFDENKRGINFRQKVNSNLGYNLNLPDYYEDDSDRAKDSLTSRLVSKTSTETPSTSEKPDVSSDNHSLIPCTQVKWIRNIGRKVTGSNVYYSIEGEATRLKSFNEIERYYLSEQQALMVEVTIPNCYKQAIRSRDASKWHDAMDKEINVEENGEKQTKRKTNCLPPSRGSGGEGELAAVGYRYKPVIPITQRRSFGLHIPAIYSLCEHHWRLNAFYDTNSVPDERYQGDPVFALQQHTTPTAGVKVWGAIAFNTRSPLVLIRGTMTAQRYIYDFLQPYVLSLMQRLSGALFPEASHGKGVTRLSPHCYYPSLV
ncbi:retrovirus-related Pol polyprotein from transposon TNT 1-94 [Trichonephila clavipes]|nr:retrovirus-related Pol polyprotein from transposon TNT 1-94 [Trichonephila clavipes]